MLDFEEIIVFKTPEQHKKSAAFVYLMGHIFFAIQSCMKILIFSEFSSWLFLPINLPMMTILSYISASQGKICFSIKTFTFTLTFTF